MGGIIYTPNYKKKPQEPDDDAGDYPVGSIWQSDDGSRWMNVWVSGEGFRWRYIDPYVELETGPFTVTYEFEGDS